jgi:hypothetical protein
LPENVEHVPDEVYSFVVKEIHTDILSTPLARSAPQVNLCPIESVKGSGLIDHRDH